MKKIIFTILVLIGLLFTNISYWEEEGEEINCSWDDSLCSPNYTVDIDWLWIGSDNLDTWWTAKETIDEWLGLIVNRLMVAFWVLSLFIMTIGWWYMIFAHGQDELLNKWKSIFTSGLIALAVALWAWIIMKLVIFLLY